MSLPDDRLLELLRAALADAEANAARYARAIEALAPIETAELTPAEPVRSPATEQPSVRKLPAKRTGAGTGKSKYDYAEVADVAVDAIEDGESVPKAVAAHFDVSLSMGQFLVGQARKRGHAIPSVRSGRVAAPAPAVAKLPDVPSGLGPIEPAPFDPEAVRLAAAGPATGAVKTISGADGRQLLEAQAERPASTSPTVTLPQGWTPEDARKLIEAAS